MFSKVLVVMAASLSIYPVNSLPQVMLLSQLPDDPIEQPAPDSWAWGRHPKNGFGYKARNTLSVEQCLSNTEFIDTPKCAFPAELCIENPDYIPLQACADAKFPKDFCLANAAQLLGAKGCQEFIVDLCSSDPSLASSPQCAGIQLPVDVCASSIEFARLDSCKGIKLPIDVCTSSLEFALLDSCKGVEFPADVCGSSIEFAKLDACKGVKLPASVCASNVEFAVLPSCADVPLPKAVCVAAAAELVSAPGCKKHLGTICVTSLELAKSDACLEGQKKVSRFQCLKNGREICLSRLCEWKVKNKDDCPAA